MEEVKRRERVKCYLSCILTFECAGALIGIHIRTGTP